MRWEEGFEVEGAVSGEGGNTGVNTSAEKVGGQKMWTPASRASLAPASFKLSYLLYYTLHLSKLVFSSLHHRPMSFWN